MKEGWQLVDEMRRFRRDYRYDLSQERTKEAYESHNHGRYGNSTFESMITKPMHHWLQTGGDYGGNQQEDEHPAGEYDRHTDCGREQQSDAGRETDAKRGSLRQGE